MKICEICKEGEHDYSNHPFLPTSETHNPLDIPFGHEVHEVNNNLKDVDEGGQGSGRQPDFGDPAQGGQQPGELVTFETIQEMVYKDIMDKKVKECPCKTRKN